LQRRGRHGTKSGGRERGDGPLRIGQKVRDVRERKVGVVTECASQYAHPKAQPVYNYLIRWEDGQVQAITETALAKQFGLELAD
jgi:hypothetical protein